MEDKSNDYLTQAYSGIDLDQPSMRSFLEEITSTLVEHDVIAPDRSLLDIGCGRGYLLEHLRRKGYDRLYGIEPSESLIHSAIFNGIRAGSFEKNDCANLSVDVVLTCHTLHHLPDRWPIAAIKEMARIARQHVVVIEINNTNLPMFALSALQQKVEVNAFRYNRNRVTKLFLQAGIPVTISRNMKSGYISGDTIFHRMAAIMGGTPYNIVVGDIRNLPM